MVDAFAGPQDWTAHKEREMETAPLNAWVDEKSLDVLIQCDHAAEQLSVLYSNNQRVNSVLSMN